MARTFSTYVVSAIVGGLFAGITITGLSPRAYATYEEPVIQRPPSKDSAEILELFSLDQSDRYPSDGKTGVDWTAVEARDLARRGEVVRLYRENRLRTNTDYYRAAVIMQHGKTPEDFLLAHEFAVAAVVLGRHSCRWLVAATEDRFLLSIGRSQRFGTQYQSDGASLTPKLHPVEEGVTDGLRQALDLPTLQEAKEREAAMARLARKGQV